MSRRGWAFVLVSTVGLLAAICVGTVTIAKAQNASQDSVAESDNPKRSMTVEGIVRDPDGKPIAGARVIALQHFNANSSWTTDSVILAETTSDEIGRYEMQVEPDSVRFSNGMYLEKEHLSVIATFAGFGPDEQTFFEDETSVDLNLVVAQQDITGQIVDLEGKPIQGVQVRLRDLQQPPSAMDRSELVDRWIEATKKVAGEGDDVPGSDPFGGNTNQPRVAFYPTAEHLRGITTLDIRTRTNDEGRFRLPGIGDDRQAILQIDGAGIASSLIPVVAREMPPINTPWMGPQYRTGKTFGSQFRLSAEPEQIVQGVVKDRETGQPISGASISLYQLPGDLQVINGFLSASSDAEGRYVLSGIPRNTKQSGGTIKIKVRPPSDQPYFRSEHSVPVIGGLEPIQFDIKLTRGIWATGKITESDSGEPVPGLVGYHPYIDNPNAADHEAFNAGMTSMGYEEMFATDADGSFRAPALRGKGILRAVAENDDLYELETVPGTRMNTAGNVTPGERMVYHNIMPGNGVVEIDVDGQADSARADISLKPVRKLMVNVVNPDGTPASGFRVAGRQIIKRMTLSGRGNRYWDDRPSTSSTLTVMLGDEKERNRPLIISDKQKEIGAVVWLDGIDESETVLTVKLKPNVKIVGRLTGSKTSDLEQAYLQPGVGDAGMIRAMFPTDGGSQIKVNKNLPFALQGVFKVTGDGSFELSVPPSERCSLLLRDFPGEPLLLDNHSAPPGSTIDLGTIDLSTDPKTWPRPKVSANAKQPSQSVAAANEAVANSQADKAIAALRLIGTVTDQSGKPLAGVSLRLIDHRSDDPGQLSKVLTQTDAQGRFTIEEPFGPIAQKHQLETIKFSRLVATKDGHGIAVAAACLADDSKTLASVLSETERRYLVGKREAGVPLVLTLPSTSEVVRGRILDSEGRPVVGAAVSTINISEGQYGSLDEWNAEAKRPGSNFYSAREKLRSIYYGTFLDGPKPGAIADVATDADGYFEIPQLGDGRIADLLVRHPTIETAVLHVRSETGDAVELPEDSNGGKRTRTYHPNRFTHVAGATQPVAGKFVDSQTGEPIEDVVVEGYRTPRHPIGGSMPPRATRAVSAADGTFQLVGLPIGKSELRIIPPGESEYLIGGVEATSKIGFQQTAMVIKIPRGVMQHGKVVEAESGKPVSGYLEYWPLLDNPVIKDTPMLRYGDRRNRYETDQEGQFQIPVLPGKGILTFMADQDQRFPRGAGKEAVRWPSGPEFNGTLYRTRPHFVLPQNFHYLAPLDLADDVQPGALNIQLDAGSTINVTVIGLEGVPVEDYYVAGQRPFDGWRGYPQKSLQVDGYNPKAGRRLLIYHPESDSVAVKDLQGKQSSTLEVSLVPSGRILGQIVDDSGEPIADAVIENDFKSFQPHNDPTSDQVAFPPRLDGKPLLTDANGRFEIFGLMPGMKYGARVSSRGMEFNRIIGEVFADISVDAGQAKGLGSITIERQEP